jgi:hypothetical protein
MIIRIQETLKEYDSILYLMIELRVTLSQSESKLEHRAFADIEFINL